MTKYVTVLDSTCLLPFNQPYAKAWHQKTSKKFSTNTTYSIKWGPHIDELEEDGAKIKLFINRPTACFNPTHTQRSSILITHRFLLFLFFFFFLIRQQPCDKFFIIYKFTCRHEPSTQRPSRCRPLAIAWLLRLALLPPNSTLLGPALHKASPVAD